MVCLCVLAAPMHARAAGNRFEKDIQKFEQQDAQTSPPQHGILFVGSSTIRIWDVKKDFPGLPVLNRGFGGSEVSDVIHFFDRVVTPYHPDTIVFYSGDNDIAAKKTTQTVINDVKKFTTMVKRELPETRLIIFPPKPSVSRKALWPEMKAVGEAERKIVAGDKHFIFLNPTSQMLDAQGMPRPELLRADGLHMNAKGYKIWADMVRPLLENSKKKVDAK
jgi:lysophospholipase L1-like esterase